MRTRKLKFVEYKDMKKFIYFLFCLWGFQVAAQSISVYPKPFEVKTPDFSYSLLVGKDVVTFDIKDFGLTARYKVEKSQNLVDWSTVVYVDSFDGRARVLILNNKSFGFYRVKFLYFVF